MLFKKLATREIINEETQAVTKTFDKECKNRPEILKKLRLYHDENAVREGISYYTVKDLPAGIMQTMYEILAFTVTCNFSDYELDGLLPNYIKWATGADINTCKTEFCTLKPEEAKELAIHWIMGLWILSTAIFIWYTCLRKAFTVTNKKNFGVIIREIFELASPPSAQRLVQRMENMNKRGVQRTEAWTRNRHESISVDLTSSDDTDIYPMNYETRIRKKRDSREKRVLVTGILTLILTMTYVGFYLNTPETLQRSLCNFLDKIRSTLL